jgi:hypothetical protein
MPRDYIEREKNRSRSWTLRLLGRLGSGSNPEEHIMIRTNIKPIPRSTTQKPAQPVVRSNVKAGIAWHNG